MARTILEDAELPVDANGKEIQLFDWEDHEGSRRDIYDSVKQAMQKQFACKEHNGVRLQITDIDYDDPEYKSISEQKKCLHEDGYLTRRLRGTATLTDINTGQVLDQKKMTLMKVPIWTNRGTFIRDGNEWGTINQTRLIPGAYSRWQNNGDLETQFNVRPGTGGSMRVIFNPEKATYKFKTAGQEFHMYSLLHDIGVSDDEMKASWGDEIFNKNKEGYDSRTFEKAYNKLVPEWDRKQNEARSPEDKVTLIKNALNRAQIATAVVKNTLPNMIDREKRASWRVNGEIMEKIASLDAADVQDIATYINTVADKNIDTEQPKQSIEQQIKNVITTGNEIGAFQPEEDEGAKVVKQIQQMRMLKRLRNKLGIDA